MLKEEDVDIEEKGKSGLEHRFWQQTIAKYFKENGYDTKIEHEIDGKSVDVYAEKGEKIGVEIAMSAKGEVENIKKDLKLNLDKLIMACKNERIMSDIGIEARNKLVREKISDIKFQIVRDLL